MQFFHPSVNEFNFNYILNSLLHSLFLNTFPLTNPKFPAVSVLYVLYCVCGAVPTSCCSPVVSSTVAALPFEVQVTSATRPWGAAPPRRSWHTHTSARCDLSEGLFRGMEKSQAISAYWDSILKSEVLTLNFFENVKWTRLCFCMRLSINSSPQIHRWRGPWSIR